MSEESAEAFFIRLRKIDPGNARCVDCNRANPQWASVNNAAYFCIDCSGRHRGVGVHLSFVRSCTMDGWNAKQRALMERGGNTRLLNFLSEHGVPANLGIEKRYATPECAGYRAILKAEAEGRTPPSAASAIAAAKKEMSKVASKPANRSSAPAMAMSGGSHGVEARAGESEADYIARQHREQAAAKERMRAKFGNCSGLSGSGSHMQGLGSNGGQHSQSDDWGFDADWISGALSTGLSKVSVVASQATAVAAQATSAAVQQAQQVAEQAQDTETTAKIKKAAADAASHAQSLLSSAAASDTVQQGWNAVSSWWSSGTQAANAYLEGGETHAAPAAAAPESQDGPMNGFTAEEWAIIQRGQQTMQNQSVQEDEGWGNNGWDEPAPAPAPDSPKPVVQRQKIVQPPAAAPKSQPVVVQESKDGWEDDNWGDDW